MSPHPSALVIEASVLGTAGVDLSGLAAHLEGCEGCRRRQLEAREARERFERSVLPRTADRVVAQAAQRRRWLMAPLILVPALALALVVSVVLPRPPSAGSDRTRVKGETAFSVFAVRQGHVFAVEDGEALRAGDRLRFEVDHPQQPYLLVASIDAAGHASIYVPYDGTASLPIESGKRFVAPESIELEAVPGPERVFVLLTEAPLAAAQVQEALRRLRDPKDIREARRLPVPVSTQLSFLWENQPQ